MTRDAVCVVYSYYHFTMEVSKNIRILIQYLANLAKKTGYNIEKNTFDILISDKIGKENVTGMFYK